jgi:catechol 2,3-dioxygenase-like lactoylglutathione lyase family enzyme
VGITHIGTVGIYVGDLDTSIDFYVNKLGFELRIDADMGETRWVEVAPPNAETSLVLTYGYAGWEPELVGKFSLVTYRCNDAQATYEQLRARGVEFAEPPAKQPWGPVAMFTTDPDGYTILITETGD